MNIYVAKHAVNKRDLSLAEQSSGSVKKGRATISGVAGKGRYKTWTAQAMLRASLLVFILTQV